MKKILCLILVLSVLTAKSQSIITATVTVTNTAGTVNGNALTINGNTWLMTNNIVGNQQQIYTANTIGPAASNILQGVTSFLPANVGVFAYGTNPVYPTNGIVVRGYVGTVLTVSNFGTWGTVSYTTNTATKNIIVRAPMSVTGTYERTNIESALVDYINDSTTTNSIQPGAGIMSNFVNTTGAQTIGGNKSFNGSSLTIGTAAYITNGPLSIFTPPNSLIAAPTIVQVNSEMTVVNPNTFLPLFDISTNSFALRGVNGNAFIQYSAASPDVALCDTNGFPRLQVDAFYGVILTSQPHNFFAVAGESYTTNIVQSQFIGPILTNETHVGTNVFTSDISFTRLNNSSLANGNNADVNVGTNVYVKVSGPSGAFAINGVAGGRDGRMVILQNSTGQTMTISNDSGSDSTSANRIYTGTGADVTCTNNPGVCELIYDASVTHWVIAHKTN